MSIVQQFLSPFSNRRSDAFGGLRPARTRFLELVHDEIRDQAGDVPLVTKVPAETAAPRLVRRHLDVADAVAIAERLAAVGYDALAPVRTSTFWDMSIVRGHYPQRAWQAEAFQDGYAEAFGSRRRARAVALLNRLQARRFPAERGERRPLSPGAGGRRRPRHARGRAPGARPHRQAAGGRLRHCRDGAAVLRRTAAARRVARRERRSGRRL